MKNVSINHQPGLTAQNELTEENEFLQSTAQALNVYVTGGGTGGGDVNLTEIDGNPVSVNSGNSDVGTQRVVIADDQNPIETLEQTGLVPVVYDAVTYTNTSSTVDTYQYYTGGTGGTLVATVTVTWTNSTKSVLVSAVRT